MSTIHFLNVGKGDCTLIQHNSGRNTLIDICKGNYKSLAIDLLEEILENSAERAAERAKGNFGMSKKPTNPISYLVSIGIKSIFRFILTHPDMDHLDGLDTLMNKFSVKNFWESGLRKGKPEFSESFGYKEEDWDRYAIICDRKENGLTVLSKLAGSRFQFANRLEDGTEGGDGLHLLSPDKTIVTAANEGGEINDASYVLLYRSAGGKILIPGDAHDDTWTYVIKHYRAAVANCSVLFAPHHGRRSGADFSFLDVVNPEITFFGCASSGHLAYDEWSRRNLPVITNNQAGNIVLESTKAGIDVYVENSTYAAACDCDCSKKNSQGYVLIGTVPNPFAAEAP